MTDVVVFSFTLRTFRYLIHHGGFIFLSSRIPKWTSCRWGDRAPLEKDKVRVMLFLELLKPGVILAEGHFSLRSGADSSRSRGDFFGVWDISI
jgi:hypothetical protein